jgi:hypothetical protein
VTGNIEGNGCGTVVERQLEQLLERLLERLWNGCGTVVELALSDGKRRLANPNQREVQRRYRERKKERLKELQEKVDTLQARLHELESTGAGQGRGLTENKHSTNVKSPHPPLRSTHLFGSIILKVRVKSRSDLRWCA